MNADKKPLPRFWYFPRGEKAVVIMTSDDHTGARHGRPLRRLHSEEPARLFGGRLGVYPQQRRTIYTSTIR